MKNGIASSVNPVVPEYMRCGNIARKLVCPCTTKKMTAVSPMATAIGISIISMISSTAKMASVSMGITLKRPNQLCRTQTSVEHKKSGAPDRLPRC